MHAESKGWFSTLFVKLTEPLIFSKRPLTLTVLTLMTVFLGYQALNLRLDAGFEKQLPKGHPYIQVLKKYQDQFGGGNSVLLAVSQKPGKGDIYQGRFLESLKAATDAVFYTPGVDRTRISSLYTPNVRFLEAVEGGFRGGNVIPSGFTPNEASLAMVKDNVSKASIIGRLVSNDQRSAMVVSELVDKDPRTHRQLDYIETAHRFETIRSRLLLAASCPLTRPSSRFACSSALRAISAESVILATRVLRFCAPAAISCSGDISETWLLPVTGLTTQPVSDHARALIARIGESNFITGLLETEAAIMPHLFYHTTFNTR